MPPIEDRACPICGGEEAVLAFEIARGADGISQNLWRCVQCGYHRARPLPSPGDLASCYGSEYGCYVDQGRPGQRSLLRRVRRIERIAGKKGRLLDVGGGTGGFAWAALQDGWDAYSLETSPYAHAQAVERLGSRAIGVGLEQLPASLDGFDAITLWAVIEHMPDPMPLLAHAVERLSKGGLLYLQSPHVGSLAARVYKGNWRLLKHSPDHVGFFTAKTMRHAAVGLGLKVVSRGVGGVPFPLGKGGAVSPNARESKPERGGVRRMLKYDLAGPLARMVSGCLRLGDNVEYALRKG